MIAAAWSVLRRELRLAAGAKADGLLPPLFFLMVITLFSLGSRPQDPQLAAYAPAILWVGALLAALLGLERLFRPDYEDGSLEQLCLAPTPLAALSAAKLLAHWLLNGLPLVLLAAPVGAALGLQGTALAVLVAGLALGTPLLSLVGGLAAALTVGLPRAGLLLTALVLPLMMPVVIFGAGAVRAAQSGLSAEAPLYFLAALLMLALTLIPWACAAILRNAFE